MLNFLAFNSYKSYCKIIKFNLILDPGPSSPHSSDDSCAASSNTNSVESPSDFQGNIDILKREKKAAPSDRKYVDYTLL